MVKPSVLNIDYQKTIDAPHYPIESGKIIENIKEYSIKNGIHYQVRKKKTCWRIKEYQDIKNHWKYGWSDVRAIDSFHGGVKYLKKYITKTIIDVDKHLKEKIKESVKKAIRTLAMLWIFSKRAFSISRDLVRVKTGNMVNHMARDHPKTIRR